MNELVVLEIDKNLQLYNKMCAAIGRCSNIDECNDIVNKSVAIAAYYKQIKDEETTLKFYRIKLRAWRRLAELLSTVDVSKCHTQAAKPKKIRSVFGNVISDMSDSRILELLKLSTISDSDFEHAISSQRISGSLSNFFLQTPQHEEQIRKWQAERDAPQPPLTAKEIAEHAAEEAAEEAERKATKKQLEITLRHHTELEKASQTALQEVGLTLERKDRANMKQVVFLIKDEVHKVMRQAAFDKKITMQEILRRGLKMWLIAHDYKFPDV